MLLVSKMSYECFAFFAQCIESAEDIYSSVSGKNCCYTLRFTEVTLRPTDFLKLFRLQSND